MKRPLPKQIQWLLPSNNSDLVASQQPPSDIPRAVICGMSAENTYQRKEDVIKQPHSSPQVIQEGNKEREGRDDGDKKAVEDLQTVLAIKQRNVAALRSQVDQIKKVAGSTRNQQCSSITRKLHQTLDAD